MKRPLINPDIAGLDDRRPKMHFPLDKFRETVRTASRIRSWRPLPPCDAMPRHSATHRRCAASRRKAWAPALAGHALNRRAAAGAVFTAFVRHEQGAPGRLRRIDQCNNCSVTLKKC